MATLAQDVPAVAGAGRASASAVASRRIARRQLAAELVFIVGLFATCAAFFALRMAVVVQPVMPRDFAFTAFAAAAAAAVAAFLGVARLRRGDVAAANATTPTA